ncbi:MAG: VCBS repeat-containing protein [Gemmataceae bacterium]|nr:VCBS repeat-containing protein [Gemmataceae bacterium]
MQRTSLFLEPLEDRSIPAVAWQPVAGDWDGVGADGIGVFDPTTAVWYLRNSVNAGAPNVTSPFPYGAPGWVPVVGDWNGDGIDSIGVFDPTTATWYLRNQNFAGSPDVAIPFQFGAPGWVPVVGDWNRDGIDTIGVFDPVTATWFLRNSNTPGVPDVVPPFQYGAPGWLPVVGDWNGDGIESLGVVNPATASWFLRNFNFPGGPDHLPPFAYGAPTWFYLAGDFGGFGFDGIATVNPFNETWFVRLFASPGVPNIVPFPYGQGGSPYYPPLGRGFFDNAFLPPQNFGITGQLSAPLAGRPAAPLAFGSAVFNTGSGFGRVHVEGYGLPAGFVVSLVAFKPGVVGATFLGDAFVNAFGVLNFTIDTRSGNFVPSLSAGDVISVFAFGTPLIEGQFFIV